MSNPILSNKETDVAYDVIVRRRDVSNDTHQDVVVRPEAGKLLGFDASKNPAIVQTGAFTVGAAAVTVTANSRSAINTTDGALTVTLPAAPAIGDVVELIDAAGTFNTNNLTVARNGLKIDSATSNLTVSTQYARLLLVYINATIGWKSYYASAAADSLAVSGAVTVGTTLTVTGDTRVTTAGTNAASVPTLGSTSTLTNKTLTTPVINGATSASGNIDLSGSTGTFKSPTGLNTIGGKMAQKVIATPVAAAGAAGGVAGAAQLGSANIVTISSDGATKGVKLGTGVPGDVVHILNTTATAANLFAASGGTINGGEADVGCAIPASKGVIAICTAADTWTVADRAAAAGAPAS